MPPTLTSPSTIPLFRASVMRPASRLASNSCSEMSSKRSDCAPACASCADRRSTSVTTPTWALMARICSSSVPDEAVMVSLTCLTSSSTLPSAKSRASPFSERSLPMLSSDRAGWSARRCTRSCAVRALRRSVEKASPNPLPDSASSSTTSLHSEGTLPCSTASSRRAAPSPMWFSACPSKSAAFRRSCAAAPSSVSVCCSSSPSRVGNRRTISASASAPACHASRASKKPCLISSHPGRPSSPSAAIQSACCHAAQTSSAEAVRPENPSAREPRASQNSFAAALPFSPSPTPCFHCCSAASARAAASRIFPAASRSSVRARRSSESAAPAAPSAAMILSRASASVSAAACVSPMAPASPSTAGSISSMAPLSLEKASLTVSMLPFPHSVMASVSSNVTSLASPTLSVSRFIPSDTWEDASCTSPRASSISASSASSSSHRSERTSSLYFSVTCGSICPAMPPTSLRPSTVPLLTQPVSRPV